MMAKIKGRDVRRKTARFSWVLKPDLKCVVWDSQICHMVPVLAWSTIQFCLCSSSSQFTSKCGGCLPKYTIPGEAHGWDYRAGRVRYPLHSDATHDGGCTAHAVQLHVTMVGARSWEPSRESWDVLYSPQLRTHEHTAGQHSQNYLQQPGDWRRSLDETLSRWEAGRTHPPICFISREDLKYSSLETSHSHLQWCLLCSKLSMLSPVMLFKEIQTWSDIHYLP